MVSANNFTRDMQALSKGRKDELVNQKNRSEARNDTRGHCEDGTDDSIERDLKAVEVAFGENMLNLSCSVTSNRLLQNAKVVKFLAGLPRHSFGIRVDRGIGDSMNTNEGREIVPRGNLAEPVQPPPAAVPDALFGECGALDAESLLRKMLPESIKFFDLPLLDRLHRRQYHMIRLRGSFRLAKLVRDHRPQLLRSESCQNPRGRQIEA
jgi:hypothetical protein